MGRCVAPELSPLFAEGKALPLLRSTYSQRRCLFSLKEKRKAGILSNAVIILRQRKRIAVSRRFALLGSQNLPHLFFLFLSGYFVLFHLNSSQIARQRAIICACDNSFRSQFYSFKSLLTPFHIRFYSYAIISAPLSYSLCVKRREQYSILQTKQKAVTLQTNVSWSFLSLFCSPVYVTASKFL